MRWSIANSLVPMFWLASVLAATANAAAVDAGRVDSLVFVDVLRQRRQAASTSEASVATATDRSATVGATTDVSPAQTTVEANRQADTNEQSPLVKSFAIESWLQLRYAKTKVAAEMLNPDGQAAQAVQFQMILPEEAFISQFSMLLGEREYEAEVKGSEEAKELYDKAVAAGQATALVEQDRQNARLFRVAVNLEPAARVLFRLTYEELLQRVQGHYEHVIYAGSPGQPVDNYTIVVHIDESLPLTTLSVEDPLAGGSGNNLFEDEDSLLPTSQSTFPSEARASVQRDVDGDASRAEVRFQPSRKVQELAGGPQGLTGQLTVSYDVDRRGENSEIQVIDGYFVHFFTPDKLPVLPQHVTFVLDKSGSMAGEKLQQLKDAMFTILNDMSEQDYFTIYIFSSSVYRWNPDEGENFDGHPTFNTTPMAASPTNKKRAISHILELEADGGTNINDALLNAVEHSGAVTASNLLPSGVQSIIIFLTDGQPTDGETDGAVIRQNIVATNNVTGAEVPIYSIAFGADADFALVRDISAEAAGAFARQVFEGANAALQLEDFYALVSSPLLAKLKFVYLGENIEVDNQTLTSTQLGTLFQGGEFVVAGHLQPRTRANETARLTASVAGLGSKAEAFSDEMSICMPPAIVDGDDHWSPIEDCRMLPALPKRSEAQNFLKHLHAFLSIRQLLKANTPSGRERAKQLALENNFVTSVTSLLVHRPDGGQEIASTTILNPPRRPLIGASAAHIFQSPGSKFSAPQHIDYEYDVTSFDEESLTRLTSEAPPRPTFGSASTSVRPGGSFAPAANCTGEISKSSQLTLYTATYHRAENVTLADSLGDLSGGPGARAVSARLTGLCCWRLYVEVNFTGLSVLLQPGVEYKSVTSLGDLLQKAKSAKKENCG